MLTYTFSLDDIVQTAISLNLSIPHSGASQAYLASYDPILALFSTGYFYLSAEKRAVGPVFGLNDDLGVSSVFLSRKPNTFAYRYSGDYDQKTYGSFLRNLGLAFDVISGSPLNTNVSIGAEKFTRHRTLVGNVTNHMASRSVLADYTLYSLINLQLPKSDNVYCVGATIDGTFPYEVGYSWIDSPLLNYDARPILDYIAKNDLSIPFPAFAGFDYYTTHIRDLAYTIVDGRVHLSYHIHIDWLITGQADPGFADTDISIFVGDPRFLPVTAHDVGDSVRAPLLYNGTYSWKNWYETDGGVPDPSGLIHIDDERNYMLITGYTDVAPGLLTGLTDKTQLSTITSPLLDSFGNAVEASLRDITPSSYHSSFSAVESISDQIDSDVFLKLGILYGLSKNAGKAANSLRLVTKATGTNWSKLGVNQVLHQAGITAGSSVQMRSAIAFLTSWVPEAAAIFNDLGSSMPGSLEGHGTFHYDFPQGTFGREKSHLITRSTVVFQCNMKMLLGALFTDRTLSLLSGLIAGGSSIPLGNLIEGLVGVRQSIQMGVAAFSISSLPIRFTHSYSILSDLTKDELDAWNASSDVSNPASLKMYVRDVSLFDPSPRDSRFDFGIAPLSSDSVGTLLLRTFLANVR